MRTRDRKSKARKIMDTYRAATPAERVEGRSWYSTARDIAESLDPVDPVRAAAVIAVLSPQTQWSVNVKRATAAYAGLYVGGLGANAHKAQRILSGENPDVVVSGPKVRAFWHAIVNPNDARAIVIDRHAIDVAYGEVMDDAKRGKILGRKGAYDEIAQWYTWAAEFLSEEFNTDISPVEVQATTWVAWRRMKKGIRIVRVYRDSTSDVNADVWFEVEDNRFICALDLPEAKESAGLGPFVGFTFQQLEDEFGPLTLISTDPNYVESEK